MATRLFQLVMPSNVDGTDTHTVGFFFDALTAQALGKRGEGNRSMGHEEGQIREVFAYTSIEDYEEHQQELARQRGLAKLSPEERKALGVGS